MDKIIPAGEGQGLLAWRGLVYKFELIAAQHFAGQLQHLLQWSFAGDMLERIEAWERALSDYESAGKEKVTDAIEIGLVTMRMQDAELRRHVLYDSDRYKTWKRFVQVITNVRHAMKSSGAAPMGIGVVGTKFAGWCSV